VEDGVPAQQQQQHRKKAALIKPPLTRNNSKFTGIHLHDAPAMWLPKDAGRGTEMHKFTEAVNAKHGLHLASYGQLWQWSVDNIAAFWALVCRLLG